MFWNVYGLYSYGLNSYGVYSDGLYSYGRSMEHSRMFMAAMHAPMRSCKHARLELGGAVRGV